MIIMVKKGVLSTHTTTYGAYFESGKILTMQQISNWDDVIKNITNTKIKRDATLGGVLFGYEYPPDTPITRSERGEYNEWR